MQDDGGTANGGVDLDPTPNTMTVNVTAVNDAPAGTDKTVTTLEDTAYTFASGRLRLHRSQRQPGQRAAGGQDHARCRVRARLTDNGRGGHRRPDSSRWPTSRRASLKFTPAANANGAGYASFTFQVQDNGGTANGGVDLDQTPNTMTVNVTAVNDAPAGTNKTVTTLEDTAYTFAAADFGFTDPNDSRPTRSLAVKITHPAGGGQPDRHGVAVTAGQIVSRGQHHGGNLKFTPAANANGAGYATFTFQVQDDGGTANGGVDLDQTPNTMTRQRYRGQRCTGEHRARSTGNQPEQRALCSPAPAATEISCVADVDAGSSPVRGHAYRNQPASSTLSGIGWTEL